MKLLIIGVALLIFGPVIAWVMFHIQQSIANEPDVPDFQEHSSFYLASWNVLMSGLTPKFVGVVSGAVGLFLILYSLIKHFWSLKREV
jgi:hypothetical protein